MNSFIEGNLLSTQNSQAPTSLARVDNVRAHTVKSEISYRYLSLQEKYDVARISHFQRNLFVLCRRGRRFCIHD